ncbi:MAG: AraC family transcriptional regulator [Paludibacter sp.]|nr:AraC family transcriptional regulator [Paludibacter sp.]
MLLLALINIARFLQLEPLPELYVYFDIFYLFAGLLAFPFNHIYFRLLTVDKKFSWKAHYRFLIFPLVLGSIYFIAVFSTPFNEYKTWLFDRSVFQDIPQIRFLKIIRLVIISSVELQAIYYLVFNTLLLKKYSNRAEQFYSNIGDGKFNNAKMLNYLLIINCLIHVVTAIDLMHITTTKLFVYSALYAIDYYMIGYMGYRQKAINPTFDVQPDVRLDQSTVDELTIDQKKILQKLLCEFDKNKIHLNSELTILDVVQVIGTNRTYVSTLINQEYNQNFCTFVNGYRMNELERIIQDEDPAINEVLAENAGFGSVKSMKRAVSSKTGLSLFEWRKQLKVQEIKPEGSLKQ